MTPGARVAAAIEVLDAYLSGTPAEQALTGLQAPRIVQRFATMCSTRSGGSGRRQH